MQRIKIEQEDTEESLNLENQVEQKIEYYVSINIYSFIYFTFLFLIV